MTPPGWETNPSGWRHRLPIILLALAGMSVASYLAAYQLGFLSSAWDPFFGDGTRRVLESGVSRLLPVPDAALGAAAYLFDAVTGAVGGTDRWRRRPWLVALFGLAIGPLGAVSISLVILQPVAFNAWCTLCLTSALISLTMIGRGMEEVLASLQHLRRVQRRGGSTWRAFWGVGARQAGAAA